MTKKRPEVPTRHLTIFLLKQGITEDEAVLKNRNSLASHEVDVGLRQPATLYIESRRSHVPSWAEFFEEQVPREAFGRISSAAAVLCVRLEQRLLAVCFGHGRYLLDPKSWDERFGLMVALNSVGEATLRSVDKKTLDPLGTHSRVQTSREASARAFGIDVEQDLVRAVTGTPSDVQSIGVRITGADALAVVIPVAIRELGTRLRTYLHKSRETSYREKFAWIDQIAEVKKPQLVADLDQDLVRRINAHDFERCWMAVPELVDWTRIQGFRFGGAKQGALVPDIAFRSFLLEYRDDEIALEQLRSRHVRAIGHDDLEVDHWPVYRCIYSETERGDETFVLSAGRWYQVSTDFVKEVNKAFSKMPGYEHPFPLFLDGSEGVYNQRIASQDAGRYALMDRRLVKAPGMSDSVEFCDLFTTGRDIIHVKHYGASSVLSHLFNQGVVSGELFALDAAFRGAVRGRLPASHRQFVQARDRPAPGAYRVVFAVISGQAGDTLSLPFFSRVAARSAARRLEGLGYLVNLAKIAVDENYAKTRVFKK